MKKLALELSSVLQNFFLTIKRPIFYQASAPRDRSKVFIVETDARLSSHPLGALGPDLHQPGVRHQQPRTDHGRIQVVAASSGD